MHTITLIRMRLDPATKSYVARRFSEGKTSRDAQLRLQRAISGQLFKILEGIEPNEGGQPHNLPQRLDSI